MLNPVFLFLFLFIINVQPIFAQNQEVHINTSLTFYSKQFLGIKNDLKSSDKGISKIDIGYDTDHSTAQLALNYDGHNNFNLDRSYLEYTSGIATFGVGAIDRHWAFSEKTSLILTHNSRPSKSIYLKLKNGFKNSSFLSDANWSLELFNGFTNGSLNSDKSMLLGARAVLSPFKGLSFELVQTSQWGGDGYNNGLSALGAALFLDTNESSNSNINKLAGFGISYSIPSNAMPFRIYGQAVGEDEAGNLPSCYAYFAGLEWTNAKIKYPTIVGIETVDTRTNTTSHGNCGPNSMYNNNTYDYTNYGTTIGEAIDTEGTSLGLYIQSQISKKINIKLMTKSFVINDNNWSNHRLSSKRQTGLINSLGVSWVKNNVSFNGNFYNQGFNLDKARIKSGYGVSISSSIIF